MNKILLGLSGGIDSAAAASLLKEQGYTPVGCYLFLTENSLNDRAALEKAKAVAEKLDIEIVTADYTERFRENVTGYFIKEYLSGRTPNPCIRCNPTVKIRSLIDTADKYGIAKIATGHYALTSYSEKYKTTVLEASPSKKDQSYFLYRLSPAQLERTVFPLGNFQDKEAVREYARRLSLPNSEAADSQEICFIPDNNYIKYICSHSDFVPEKGSFIDIEGNVIGTHSGIINYTVGQRKGLGAFGEPRYVKEINARDNTVTLCKSDERFSMSLKADRLSFITPIPSKTFTAAVKIRSTAKAAPAEITIKDGIMNVSFSEKVLAPTPGQSAVIYEGSTVIGGGIIL